MKTEVCKICGVKTANPAKHKVKYKEIHKRMEKEGMPLRDILVERQQDNG